jgi:anaerobic magnesium-protoporphyrin IX monomethyl ester cyclase
MKILLLNPPFLPKYSRSSRSPAVTKSGTIYYPLWLAHATGVLEKGGYAVKLIDAPAEGLSYDETYQRVSLLKPDLTVLDTSTPSIFNDIKVAEEIKKICPGTFIVLVGTHPSALAEETLGLSDSIDAVARREYDYTILDLANIFNSSYPGLSGVQGLTFRENGKIINNQDRPFIEDLDRIPFVSSVYKKHLNINNYFYAHCQNPVISIFAGRGCPNQCFYCLYPQVMFGRRYRHRSVIHFVEELAYIRHEFPQVREILIDDDNFTADQMFVAGICDEILRRGLKVTWTCEARVNLRYEIMIMMKRAGCRLLVAGFESGNQCVLDSIKKGTTLAQAQEFAINAKKADLRVHGCFMVGNRGETALTLQQTLAFSLRLPIDTAQYFPLMVYPGTEAYDWASKNGYIRAANFSQWLTKDGMHNCVVNTGQLIARDLVDFCDYSRRRYYLRPRYLAYKMVDVIRNRGEAKRTARAAYKLITHLFKKHH